MRVTYTKLAAALAAAIAAACACPTLAAPPRFDAALLAGGAQARTALARINAGALVQPGTYNVALALNRRWVARTRVRFAAPTPTATAVPCITSTLLRTLGLSGTKYAKALTTGDAACVQIDALIHGASATFDQAKMRLAVTIPQADLPRRPRGWSNPATWTYGIPAAFVQYDMDAYRTTTATASQTSAFAMLRGGFNIGPWQFRQDSDFDWMRAGGRVARSWTDVATYVQRAFPKYRSELTIGDAFTHGNVFDSYSFRGVQATSVNAMLPQSRRGFAPVVRGVAATNAQVTIRQHGQVIDKTNVPPGPFRITDLPQTGTGGNLTVTVTEADGSQHTFVVPDSSVPNLVRPHVTDYQINVGQLRDPQIPGRPWIVQGAAAHGINNLLTGYAGLQAAQGYDAALIGAAWNTRWGALSADLTATRASLPGAADERGASLRLRYARSIPGGGAVSASARWTTPGYTDLRNAEAARGFLRAGLAGLRYLPVDPFDPQLNLALPPQDRAAALRDEAFSAIGELRERYGVSVSASEPLGRWGSVYADVADTSYANTEPDKSFQVGFSTHIGRAQIQLTAGRTAGFDGRPDTRLYASLQLPLGHSPHAPMFSADAIDDGLSGAQEQIGVDGTAGRGDSITYNAMVQRQPYSGTLASGTVGWRSPWGQFSGGLSRGAGTTQESFGATGTVLAFRHGVLFGGNEGGSGALAIARVAGGDGATVGYQGARVDRGGYALVPGLISYQPNTISLDTARASKTLQVSDTTATVVPVAGAVALVDFRASVGRSLILRIVQAAGKPVPFGAAVTNAAGKRVGTVIQGGSVLLRPVERPQKMAVTWGRGGHAHGCEFVLRPVRAARGGFAAEGVTCTARGAR